MIRSENFVENFGVPPESRNRRKSAYHLVLVLNEELDTLNGGSGGLGDGLVGSGNIG